MEELWDGGVASGFQGHGGGCHTNVVGNVTLQLDRVPTSSSDK